MAAAGEEGRQNFGYADDGVKDELDAEIIGEGQDEVVLRTAGALGAEDEGRRTIARTHAQLARLEDFIQEIGRCRARRKQRR